MREIKFRVFDKKNNRFIQGGNLIFNLYDGYPYYEVDINEECMDNGENRQNDFIAQQYTGVKDKNGVEIYEGDIVLWKRNNKIYKDWVGPVVWDNEHSTFRIKKDGLWFKPQLNKHLEVIGNIYENKELLNDNV